jgi:hypothetical protein
MIARNMSKNIEGMYIKIIYMKAIYITRNKTINIGDRS